MLLCGYFRNKKICLIIRLLGYFRKHLVLIMDTEFTVKWEINFYMRGSCKIFSESEKYKTVQSSKPHFFQNCPLMQLYTAANDCKGSGNITFLKAFIAPSHSY